MLRFANTPSRQAAPSDYQVARGCRTDPSSKRWRALGNHECGTAPFATESLRETPAFEKLRKERNIVKMPVLEATSKYRLEALVAIGLKVTEVAWVGILSVFAVAYLTKQLN